MHIGVTGTRYGMTEQQKNVFKFILKHITKYMLYDDYWLHHGDCIGADSEAHDIAVSLGFFTHIHPPINSSLRAFKNGCIIEKEENYFQRNRNIVNTSNCMIATPKNTNQSKGGTWYTINYSKKKNKNLYIIYPDGNIENFNNKFPKYNIDLFK